MSAAARFLEPRLWVAKKSFFLELERGLLAPSLVAEAAISVEKAEENVSPPGLLVASAFDVLEDVEFAGR